jgi:hypothetical protein
MAHNGNETGKMAQMGMAAMLPGMVYMLELMQEQVQFMQEQLMAMQRQAKSPKSGKGGWPADAEARSAEQLRRRATRERNQKQARANAKRKQSWDAQPAKVKKARIAAMLAGRLAKKVPAMEKKAA